MFLLALVIGGTPIFQSFFFFKHWLHFVHSRRLSLEGARGAPDKRRFAREKLKQPHLLRHSKIAVIDRLSQFAEKNCTISDLPEKA